MNYTDEENQALQLMEKLNFKSPSKEEILRIISKLADIRPDAAKEILDKYPQFVTLLKSSAVNYKETLHDIIQSDDKNLAQFYKILEKDQESTQKSRDQFFDLAGKVVDDIGKCLDNSELSTEERDKLLDRELEILKIASDKDSELRTHETETIQLADKKEAEKKQFNWAIVEAASFFAIGTIIVMNPALLRRTLAKVGKKIVS